MNKTGRIESQICDKIETQERNSILQKSGFDQRVPPEFLSLLDTKETNPSSQNSSPNEMAFEFLNYAIKRMNIIDLDLMHVFQNKIMPNFTLISEIPRKQFLEICLPFLGGILEDVQFSRLIFGKNLSLHPNTK